MTSLSNTDSIFFLPRSHDFHMNPDLRTSPLRGHDDPRLDDRDPLYRNDLGFQVTRSPPLSPDFRDPDFSGQRDPHRPLSYQRSQPLIFNDTQPLVSQRPRPRSRSQPSERSHRFPSDPYDPRSPLPRAADLAYPEYPPRDGGYPGPYLSERSPRDRSPPHQQRLPPSQPPPPYRSSGGSGGDDYPPKPSRRYDSHDGPPRGFDGPPPRGYDPPQRGGVEAFPRGYDSPQRGLEGPQRGYDGPFQSFQSEDDDVFPPGSQPPPPPPDRRAGGTLPRHSSLKPGAQQTYLTGEEGEEEPQAFTLSDISSVLDPPQDQSSGLPPPRRSWQPSQESSRSFQPPSYSADGSGDRGRGPPSSRDKPLARVWPSPKTADDSSDSSGRPLGYTRDQLHDVVDRLRHAPRSRSAPGDRYLDVSAQGSTRGSGRDLRPPYSPAGSDPSRPGGGGGRGGPAGHHDPHHHHGAGYPSQRYPEDSTSSGIGSRNTSQSTSGSLRPRSKPYGNSMSSLLTPHESSLAEDSSSHPFLDPYSPGHRRDTSADENYEFDHLPALESDILDDLHRYSQLAGSGRGASGDVMKELYPKPRRQSQYSDASERFERLREEYKQFRQLQEESDSPPYIGPPQQQQQQHHQQHPLYPMDSEML